MEISVGSMSKVFEGLNTAFVGAIDKAEPPDVERMVQIVPSTIGTEFYPTAGLFGDLEEMLDELTMTNLVSFLQEVENVVYARGFGVPRLHVINDQLGMYGMLARRLGTRAATFPYRRIGKLLVNGTATAWIDGSNIFANAHTWPGGQTWDNLDALPLTAANFEIVVRHLEGRVDPDGEEMGLKARLLVCGTVNKVDARRILNRELIGGGDSNIHFEETDLLVLPNLGYHWAVIDDEEKPIIWQDREPPALVAQDSEMADSVFYRETYNYKARRTGAHAIVEPWRIQFVDWNSTSTTTAAS